VGVAVGLAVEVAVGAAVEVAVGLGDVVPPSVGSPVAVGELVAPLSGALPPPSQAPRTVARLNNRAKPKILVFITPLSPIVARTIFAC
jgi:hypothetical protein